MTFTIEREDLYFWNLVKLQISMQPKKIIVFDKFLPKQNVVVDHWLKSEKNKKIKTF